MRNVRKAALVAVMLGMGLYASAAFARLDPGTWTCICTVYADGSSVCICEKTG